jgi:surface carbohydrate biosynthesis protein (TIGR04326 family)
LTVQTLTLWDSPAEPSDIEGKVCRWNGYVQTDQTCSLLGHVESHGERLRQKYLAWIHDLAECRIADRRVVDHLALGEDLSYWWMTLLAEKNPWKSPSINDAVRLLALEEIVADQKPSRLRLVSADYRLNEVASDFCRNLNIAYEWRRLERKPLWHWTLADIYRTLPQPVQALISLGRRLAGRWSLRGADKSGWIGGDRALLFCSYFVHLDKALCEKGEFYSRQWEGIPKLLQDEGFGTNWIQHYLPSSAVPNTRVAKEWVRSFNRKGAEIAFHSFLDTYLSPHIVFRVLYRWIGLNIVHWRLRGIRSAFRPRGSSLSFWPVMHRDWHGSLCGAVAMSNLLWIELFGAALADLPRQQRGLYLCEGQSWERAFIHAWRKNDHGRLIGVAHSTVRFWDLRYFEDPRTVRSADPLRQPQPDLVALNGKAAIDALSHAGYPKEKMAECEAVRYAYLNDLRAAPAQQRARDATIKVLILGDITSESTTKLLRLLEGAVGQLPTQPAFTVKPHPNCMVNAQDYPSLSLTVVTNALAEILLDFDIAYASSSTSAAVDAYLAGLPVVVMLDGAELNLSPLRARPGVRFVSTSGELAASLQTKGEGWFEERDRADFFFLDPKLPRWRKLLGIETAFGPQTRVSTIS